MRCRDVALSLVVKCHQTDSAQLCALLMELEGSGLLPVVDGDERLVGVVTDRDLALRVVGANLPARTPVREVMTAAAAFTCALEDDLRDVESAMARRKTDHLLVVDQAERCVGMISLADLEELGEPRAALPALAAAQPAGA